MIRRNAEITQQPTNVGLIRNRSSKRTHMKISKRSRPRWNNTLKFALTQRFQTGTWVKAILMAERICQSSISRLTHMRMEDLLSSAANSLSPP